MPEPSVELLSTHNETELAAYFNTLTVQELRDLRKRTTIHWRDHVDTARDLALLSTSVYEEILGRKERA